MEKIASGFIRNSGSMGENLMMTQRKHFPSDIATILLPVGTIVNIMIGQKHEKLTVDEFLGRPPLDSKTILLSIRVPCWESRREISSETDTKLLFETYRAAPRPLGNALPYLNAAFLAEVSFCRNSTEVMVNNCQLAFGAYGNKHPIRARKVEEFLTGKLPSVGVLYEAIELLGTTIIPEDGSGTSSPAYSLSLVVGFLYEFMSPLVHTPAELPGGWCNGYNSAVSHGDSSSEIKEHYDKFNGNKSPTLLSSSKQLESLAFISVKDIPGKNLGSSTVFGEDPLYADELIQCARDRIAFVVADTQRHAEMVANLAVIDYDKESLEPPILSVVEAVERASFFQVPSFLYPKQVGDFSKGMAEANHQILSAKIKLGSQYYSYMETQTALAVPDEDNSMVV
ncbi:hypothetical protein REPUB_Repub15cG0021000 [Reevesia pubescens]